MSKATAREVASYADQLAKAGNPSDRVIRLVVRAYAPDWPLRDRLSLAWKLVRGR